MIPPKPKPPKPRDPRSATDAFIDADSANISVMSDQLLDNILHVMVDFGAELWTMRRRMAIMERVLEKVGVSSDDIEQYHPTPEEQAAWREERDIFINRAFGALARTGGANAKQMDTSKDYI
jgi:hypothetical protein